jgi:CHAD domain-containing protein
MLERQLRELESSEAGVRSGADPEDLHRFRVATRRSRALIRASRPLVRDQLGNLDRELRWLGGASGAVRDLDVMIEHLRDLIGGLEPDQAGGEAIVAALERERLEEREELVRAIDTDRFRALIERFESALPTLGSSNGGVSMKRLVRKEYERLSAAYKALDADSSDEELHAVRIRAKHVRYAAELAARSGQQEYSGLASAARALQELIGTHQDAVVTEQRVRALAREESRLAAGRIVEAERRRRVEARAKLRDAWRDVKRAASKAR